jgi:hypothetical protein
MTARAFGNCCINRPAPPAMVEMHVGQDHVVDCVGRKALGAQLGEQPRHRIVRAGIDKCRASVLDDQVTRVELRTKKARVDRADAVFEVHVGSYLIGIPAAAPLSASSRNNWSPPDPADRIMPSDTPKRILRGASLR